MERTVQNTYLKVTDKTIRVIIVELAATTLASGQDPDNYFTGAIKHGEVEALVEPMNDRLFTYILVQLFLPRVREHQDNDASTSDL